MFDEPFAEAWNLRFGVPPPTAEAGFGRFLNHRSVRKYRAEPISEALMAGLLAAGQSASTSSNLQLYTFISVQDPARREAIAKLCADQNQVRDAAWFLAGCVDHYRLREAAKRAGQDPAGLDFKEFFIMGLIDLALAAERMVCAAESFGLGVCYIGALRNDPQGVSELLELPEGVFGAFGLCLGWPEEPLTAEIKPRLGSDSIHHRETYRKEVDVEEYDRRMAAFYESQGMKGDVTWSMRSGRRVDGSERSLTGRGVLKGWLEARGFGRR